MYRSPLVKSLVEKVENESRKGQQQNKMATSMLGQMFVKGIYCVPNCLRQESVTSASKVLINYQQQRGNKRSSRPPNWFVKKNKKYVNDYLTKPNMDFLEDFTVEHFKPPPESDTFSPLKEEPWPRGQYKHRMRRVGVIGVQIGVIPQWRKDGTKVNCTVVQVLDNHVIKYTPPEEFHGTPQWKPWYRMRYGHCVVGALSCYPWKYTKSYTNLFLEAGVPPKRKLTRFLIHPEAKIQPGTPLNVMHFRAGDYVDCSSKTIGHGFQGVVTRWRFAGGPATHGSNKFHRKPGSTGNIDHRGIVKGKRLPGHMGMNWNIEKGLKIMRINTEKNLLYIAGIISGPNHSYVRIYDSTLSHKLQKMDNPPPVPTFCKEDIKGEVPKEYFAEELYQFTSPSIIYTKED